MILLFLEHLYNLSLPSTVMILLQKEGLIELLGVLQLEVDRRLTDVVLMTSFRKSCYSVLKFS